MRPSYVVIGSLAAVLGLVLLLVRLDDAPGASPSGTELLVHCAAGIRPAVEPLAREYEAEYGVTVHLRYGGSGDLLSGLRAAPSGDLFVAGDDSYLARGREHGVVAEIIPLARMRPVLAVPRGNPRGVAGVRDLLREDLAIGLANPEAAAVGKAARRALESIELWPRVRAACRVLKPTVTDLANDVRLGTLDVAILWDATVAQYEDLEAVDDPALSTATRHVSVGVVTATEAPTAALRFARFLGSRDRGGPVFERSGYRPADGDVWTVRPEVVLYGGAMLRPAVDDTIAAFEAREGVSVRRVYNGCGLLVSQIEAEGVPDAFLTCDASFLDRVASRFGTPTDFSENDVVIAVAAKNPHGIAAPRDLLRDGVRVGLAHPDKSALGHLCRRWLGERGLWESLWERRVVDSATGDLLVNALRVGSLDAALVYRSNVMGHPAGSEHLAIIAPEAPATARQNRATSLATSHRNTLERLFEALDTAGSRERFERGGFRWVREDGR